jgi:predicted ester cyclase
MSAEQIRDFIRRYLEALSGKDKTPELVEQWVTDEGLKQHIALFEAAFPRYWLKAEDMIVEGDKVAVRATFGGTHQGDLMGIAPTGKEILGDGILIYRIENAKIVEFWAGFDQLTILQQLGAIPAPGGGGV